jgi:hypothetical protein
MIVKSLAINQNWLDPDQLAIGSFSGAVGLPTIEAPAPMGTVLTGCVRGIGIRFTFNPIISADDIRS